MFSDGTGISEMDDSANTSVVLMDLSANEKTVHADFFNDFEDLFDDENDEWTNKLYYIILIYQNSIAC